MKIRKGFVVREVAGSIVAVPTEDLLAEFNCIINLNDTGEFIWKLLSNEDLSLEAVSEKYAEKYNISVEQAREKTEKYINKLIEAHIIEQ